MYLLIAVPCFLIGLLHFFAKEFFWRMTYFSLQMQGIEAERTPLWYTLMNLYGIVFIGIAIAAVYLGATVKW